MIALAVLAALLVGCAVAVYVLARRAPLDTDLWVGGAGERDCRR